MNENDGLLKEGMMILIGLLVLLVLAFLGIFSKKIREYNRRLDTEASYR